jgi:trigger factor
VRSTLKTLNPTQVHLCVEVPADELEPGLIDAYREIAERGATPDWHDCRIPFQIIDRCAGATVLPHAVEQAVLARIRGAAQEHDIEPLGRPRVDITGFGVGQRLAFTAVMDVRTELTLPDLSAIAVEVNAVTVADHEIDEHLEQLRRQRATFTTVERPAADGDTVRLDLTASFDGLEVPGGNATNVSYQIGCDLVPTVFDGNIVDPALLADGLNLALTGLSAGDSAEVHAPLFGGPYADKDADVSVTVLAITEPHLPDLDDTLARQVGDFDGVTALRDHLRENLVQARKTEQLYAARDRALAQIFAATAVPVPDSVVDDEVEHRKHWMLSELERIGTSLAADLTITGQTEQDIENEIRMATIGRIRTRLVLGALADAENIEVTQDDYRHEVIRRAKLAGVPPETYHQQTERTGASGTLLGDVILRKAMTVLMRRITITDTEGHTVTFPEDVDQH